jgi:hypothetical protein
MSRRLNDSRKEGRKRINNPYYLFNLLMKGDKK